MRRHRSSKRIPLVIPVAILLIASALVTGRIAYAADPVLAAGGDISCASSTATATSCRQMYTSDILVQGGIDAVAPLGDLQYPNGELSNFQTYYDPSWGRVKALTHPAPGNHEYNTPGASGYYTYWGSAAGDPSTGYYSYDLGTWHVIALNSNCSSVGGCGIGSTQEKWLRADLAAHPTACTVAYWHHPRFSSGKLHGSSVTYQPFWQALYDFGADVVLNGHEHLYERFAPQSPSGAADANGIREFVAGTGGSQLYAFGTPIANSQVRNSDTFGVLKLTLHPTSYDWSFVPEAGKTFTDSGTENCVTGSPPPPSGGDFSLSASPSSRSVVRGDSTSYTVTITPTGGFSNPVNLSVSGLPTGATATFNPNPATTTSTMTVATSPSTKQGNRTLTITGSSGSVSHTTAVSLAVKRK